MRETQKEKPMTKKEWQTFMDKNGYPPRVWINGVDDELTVVHLVQPLGLGKWRVREGDLTESYIDCEGEFFTVDESSMICGI